MSPDQIERLQFRLDKLSDRVQRLTIAMAVLATLILGDGALRLIGV